MATLHPFRALRPRPDHVREVACVPYDVINTAEARALADGKPLSFLHVIRPEIDLPEGTDEHADRVYEQGAANLRTYAAGAASLQEETPSLYVYRLVMDGREQTGIFGCVAVAEYDDDTILKHEKTRPTKEDDRTRHIVTQRAHAEPVMLAYRDDETVGEHIEAAKRREPLYDFTADDGVQHTIWRVDEPEALAEAFEAVEKLYVADGHHRCKAASRAADEVGATPEDEAAYFPAVLFPFGQMKILAYNRIVRALPGERDTFLSKLHEHLDTSPTDEPTPRDRGYITLYVDGQWYEAVLPPTRHHDTASQLDVARLGEHVLAPLFGITDPRTDPAIDFVGGIRGTDELERLVDGGQAALAIAMYPTSIDELVDVSDAGELMPPKSTWFEPKLRSGLLVHLFDDFAA